MFSKFMNEALKQAKSSPDEIPVGAVLVHKNEIIAKASNSMIKCNNPLMHAEINAINEGLKRLGTMYLSECDLYVTLEPCVMCMGAILNSRIKRVYFGAYDVKYGASHHILNLMHHKKTNHYPEIYGGIMENECRKLLEDFFLMKYILNNIKLGVDFNDKRAILYIKEKYFKKTDCKISIFKKSVDARNKSDIKFCFSFLLETKSKEDEKKVIKIKNITPYTQKKIEIIKNNKSLKNPVVVGAGPAGLFCAYYLAKYGYNPIIFERGEKIEDRHETNMRFLKEKILNPNSNVQFGEGGAGAFSDGKLTTRINNPLCGEIVEILGRHSEIPELKYHSHPHIGTDRLKKCVKNLREEIISMGGEFHFNERVTDLKTQNNKIKGIKTENGEYETDTVILATGHSAKDIYKMLCSHNVPMEQKSFSVGVRVEHKREDINKIQYGAFYNHKNLGSAEYQIFHHLPDRTVYSFCMCPGGTVVAAQSEEETVIVNGMSEYMRNGENSNSAICVSVSPKDFGNNIFDGLEFIEKIEKNTFIAGGKDHKAPVIQLKDFLKIPLKESNVTPTYPLGVKETNFNEIFPEFLTESLKNGFFAFENKMKGFVSSNPILTASETRTSAPLKITRNKQFESPYIKGLYPCGEGAGQAGGIVSAAVDGAKIAISLITKE